MNVPHLFTLSSSDGHLASVHVLVIIKWCLREHWVRVSFQILIFYRYIPRSEIAGSCGSSVFSFLRTLHTVLPEQAMAPHSSTLAWKIPWAEEPGRLQSMGLRRVGYD